LVIRAVRARDKLLVFSLEWKPCFKIVFFRCGVVESTRDNCDDTIWNVEGLVKGFGDGDHAVKFGPGFFGFTEDKLFNLQTT